MSIPIPRILPVVEFLRELQGLVFIRYVNEEGSRHLVAQHYKVTEIGFDGKIITVYYQRTKGPGTIQDCLVTELGLMVYREEITPINRHIKFLRSFMHYAGIEDEKFLLEHLPSLAPGG